MVTYSTRLGATILLLISLCLSSPYGAAAQEGIVKTPIILQESKPLDLPVSNQGIQGINVSLYFDAQQGSSSDDLIRRALTSNAELSAVRLDIERGRARIQQSKLRPNPSVDFQQTTDKFTGATGERETSVGFSLPIELGGKRKRRIDLAQAELAAAEAEVDDRERRLVLDIRFAYTEALAALRELQITENLIDIGTQVARLVEARVKEGDSAPLELSLMQVEADRLVSRRALVEGRLQAAILKLKNLAGISPNESLRLRETLLTTQLPEPSLRITEAIDVALRTRPDARLARLLEEAAQAGLRLARAQATPDLSAFSRYTVSRSLFDETPVGILSDKDKLLTFGVSINLPLFNRNQGAKAEAAVAIQQAQRRREFIEATVRSEVGAAYARYEAARNSLAIFEKGVVERSTQNIRAISRAYELGAYSITELLFERRRLLDAEREFIDALSERYRALAEIQSALGTPLN
jgi:cobalt-zinc-cadmium efflux system outer membrane protein